MKLLVTGGAGFIGSHVVDACLRAGHAVWVLDDLSRGKRENVNTRANFIRMDLRSPEVRDVLASGAFDAVIHHAAQIDVRVSVADPIRDATVNVIGTLNLLEAVRVTGVPRFLFASTGGAIYGKQRHFPAPEQHPTQPLSPYGVAKLAVEHYLEYYHQVHGLDYVVLRYANVYGPRQDPQGEAGVIAIFCERILGRQHLVIYGDGAQTRDYVHVEDVARANVLALTYLESSRQQTVGSGQHTASDEQNGRRAPGASLPTTNCQLPTSTFNIGTGIETSVNALAALLVQAADVDCRFVYQPPRTGEQLRSAIDPSLAKQVLGWTPLIAVEEGLLGTMAWFRTRLAARRPSVVGGLR